MSKGLKKAFQMILPRVDSDEKDANKSIVKKKHRSLKACDYCKHKRIRCEFINLNQGCKNCMNLNNVDCSLLNDQFLLSLKTNNSVSPILSTNKSITKHNTKMKNHHFKIIDTVNNKTIPLFENQSNSKQLDLIQDTNLKVTKLLEILTNNNTSTKSINNHNQPLFMSPNDNEISIVSDNLVDTNTSETPIEQNNEKNVENNRIKIHTDFQEDYRSLYAPFTNLTRYISKLNIPLQIRNLHDPNPLDLNIEDANKSATNFFDFKFKDDVISQNILTMSECITLLKEFKDNYGAWVSFPQHLSLEVIIENIRNSNCSLLLTLYMVLSLRYTLYYHDLKTKVYKSLLLKLKYDYAMEFVNLGNAFKIEYIQSLVMLSVYSNSLSSDLQIFDSWLISGLGLKMYFSNGVKNNFQNFNNNLNFFSIFGDENELNDISLSHNRLYNHLCLAHLNHSLLSGRPSILQDNDIKKCILTLQSQRASHFDGRMLAEIELYWLMERFQRNGLKDSDSIQLDFQVSNINENSVDHIQGTKKDMDLNSILSKIDQWWHKWIYLSKQQIEEFIDFTYHFSYANMILMYYQKHKYIPPTAINKPISYYSRKRLSSKIKEQITKKDNLFKKSNINNFDKLKNSNILMNQFPMFDLNIPPIKKQELSEHCIKALELFKPVDLNHFRFLSDQLIYSVFYTAVIYLKFGIIDDKGKILVKELSEKFRKIREGELKSFWIEEVDLKVPSCILQYYASLEALLREYEIETAPMI